ncbi:hypothetical protein HNO88_004271 [Novosphingobium chloroacetimidivorans]|uniref:Uncharacterized protein n=1 Tax=Novosphingobium chloroacetimidivorans TaxID=1428314 RepID=A0A7W7KEA6_9SPHN|nr:hypothetical protein [Novosphingobium chloroacetimidivorans]
MPLRSVHEEGMAQKYRPSFAHSKFFSPMRRAGESVCGKITKRQAGFADWGELPGDVSMRASPNACRRIIGTNIRKQEQHQQGSSPAAHIGAPLHEVWVFVTETDVDVPAIVSSRILGGEADREGAEADPRIPAANSDELVECRVQSRRIRRLSKRSLAELIEA